LSKLGKRRRQVRFLQNNIDVVAPTRAPGKPGGGRSHQKHLLKRSKRSVPLCNASKSCKGGRFGLHLTPPRVLNHLNGRLCLWGRALARIKPPRYRNQIWLELVDLSGNKTRMPSNKIELLRSDASYDVQRFNDQNVTLRIGHAGKGFRGWV
jgi:hypothetical protein